MPSIKQKKEQRGFGLWNVSDDDGLYAGYLFRTCRHARQASPSGRLSRPLSLLCANRGLISPVRAPSTLETERPHGIWTPSTADSIPREAHVLEVFGIPYSPMTVGPGNSITIE